MEMKKETAVVTVEVKPATTMGNRRVKFNRIVGNVFRWMFLRETKLPTVDEVSVEGIFAAMRKEKAKLDKVLKAQDAAIALREKAAETAKVKADEEVEELQKQIKEAQDKLQEKLALEHAEKTAISAEKERVAVLKENMDTFFTKKL